MIVFSPQNKQTNEQTRKGLSILAGSSPWEWPMVWFSALSAY